MSKFHIHIVTPYGVYKDDEADILNIRTSDGQLGIMANHIPIATDIEISEMNYVKDNNRYYFSTSGGFMYFYDNTATLILNAIESPEEIDLRRAQEAEERAKRLLSSNNPDIDMMRAELALKRALVRINVKNL